MASAYRPALRRVAAVLLGGAFAFCAVLPPEHCHPSSTRGAAVVHRHAQLHVVSTGGRLALAANDGLVLRLDGSYLPGQVSQFAAHPPHLAVTAAWPALPDSPRLSAVVFPPADRAVHDPPWRPSEPRAPPVL